MALFVLAFAIALASLDRARVARACSVSSGSLLAAASVFTFSIPGLAWFVVAVPVWLVLEALGGRRPIDWRAVARCGRLAPARRRASARWR